MDDTSVCGVRVNLKKSKQIRRSGCGCYEIIMVAKRTAINTQGVVDKIGIRMGDKTRRRIMARCFESTKSICPEARVLSGAKQRVWPAHRRFQERGSDGEKRYSSHFDANRELAEWTSSNLAMAPNDMTTSGNPRPSHHHQCQMRCCHKRVKVVERQMLVVLVSRQVPRRWYAALLGEESSGRWVMTVVSCGERKWRWVCSP